MIFVDDDELDNRVHARVLERSGWTPNVDQFLDASAAMEAICSLESVENTIVFVDINMPRMTGFEFVEAVHERLGDHADQIRFVMLSTSQDGRDREAARVVDLIDDFLLKPLTVEALREMERKHF